MNRVIAIAIAAFVLVALMGFGMRRKSTASDDYSAFTKEYVKRNLADLQNYCARMDANQIRQEPGKVTFPPPDLEEPKTPLQSVTRDANGNLYFVIHSSTFHNAGFIRRVNNSEILGDRMEPRLTYLGHLFDEWWCYGAQ